MTTDSVKEQELERDRGQRRFAQWRGQAWRACRDFSLWMQRWLLSRYTAPRALFVDKVHEQLSNCEYAGCDAAFRKHVERTAAKPLTFPYSVAGE